MRPKRPGDILLLEPFEQREAMMPYELQQGEAYDFVLVAKPARLDHCGEFPGQFVRQFDLQGFHDCLPLHVRKNPDAIGMLSQWIVPYHTCGSGVKFHTITLAQEANLMYERKWTTKSDQLAYAEATRWVSQPNAH